MFNLPLEFRSKVRASSAFEEAWQIDSGPIGAKCAIPHEFGGSGGGFSPEDLFLQSVMNCFVGTFKVYAKASKVLYSDLSLKGQLTVDRTEDGKIVMKAVALDIEVYGADKPHRVEVIVDKVLKEGFIINSVKSEIRHSLQVFDSTSDVLI